MRNVLSLTILGLIAFGLSGCKLIDELRTFDIPYSVNFTIPSSIILNLPLNLPTVPVTTNTEQHFQDEGIESAWVESVKLTSLRVTITAPAGEDFSFLENISMYMNTNGQSELLIADKIPVPAEAGNSIQLDVKNADLYPYISQDDFSIRTSVTTDETMTQDITFKADMVIEVKATIPGGN
ncbi:MAG: hypothetical protein KBF73_07795 [Flavobacteriales bacterium]|nr:hypothetical protein [Flavobacteriales bacterium]